MAPGRRRWGKHSRWRVRGPEPREQLAAIYGALATGCGYPYPVIDAMTLAEAGEIFAYWEHDPPAHLIVQSIARLLGWTPRPVLSRTPRIDEIAASAPPGLAVERAARSVCRRRFSIRGTTHPQPGAGGRDDTAGLAGPRTPIVARVRWRLTCRGTWLGRAGCGGAGFLVPLVP